MPISDKRLSEEEDDDTTSTSHGVNSPNPTIYRGPWTKEMDIVMVKTLKHQASRGIKLDGMGSNTNLCCAIIKDLRSEMNAYASHSDVLYRLSWHKKNGDTIRRILAKPGFSWDGRGKRIVADKEIWSQELEFHPLYHLFTYASFPVYEEIMPLLPDEIVPSRISVSTPTYWSRITEGFRLGDGEVVALETPSSTQSVYVMCNF